MEVHYKVTRFIFICNYVSRLCSLDVCHPCLTITADSVVHDHSLFYSV